MASLTTPLIGVVIAIVAWGSFTSPSKAPSVVEAKLSFIWIQFYLGVGVGISSLALLLVPGAIENWTWYGVASGFIWYAGNLNSMAAVQILGVATAQAGWAGIIVFVSFLEGVFFFGQTTNNLPLTIVGLLILVIGIAVIAVASSPVDDLDEEDCNAISTPEDSLSRLVAATSLLDAEHSATNENTDQGERTPRPRSSSVSSYLGVVEMEVHPDDKESRPNRLTGFCCLVGVGVLAGSVFIPLNLAPERYQNTLEGGLHFAMAQGLGAGVAAFVYTPILLMINAQVFQPTPRVPPMHFELWVVAPTVICGLLWNIGNIGAILATQPPLGSGIGYPMTQAALIVGALWGVFFWKEISHPSRIRLFFVGLGVTIAGVVMVGAFGKAS